jgi:microcystin-dependent protein
MGQPYVGEIRMMGCNFAPVGWMFCSGQTLPISENETLFQLIGTTYGGDGQETFQLPDLQGRVPMHQGSGFVIGQKSGTENVTLSTQQMPQHNHGALTTAKAGSTNIPDNTAIFADTGTAGAITTYTPFLAANAQQPLLPQSLTITGGSQPHDNMQPFLVINFIISLFGVFPQQN